MVDITLEFRCRVLGTQFHFDSEFCTLQIHSLNSLTNVTEVEISPSSFKWLEDVPVKTFKNLRHHALSIQFRFDVDANALQEFIHDLDITSTTIINTVLTLSWHNEGIMQSPAHCGRESRHTCRLSHSEVFRYQSSRWSCIPRLSYTFLFFYISHMIKLLTIFFIDPELQVDYNIMPEGLQIQTMHRLCKFIINYAPSRFLSNISLSSRRIVCWFWFYFPFFEGFLPIFSIFLQAGYLDVFPFSRLVGIQINELIYWTVGLNTVIRVRSALAGWPGDVTSIECPDDRLIPESFPVVEVPRRGFDDTRTDNTSRTMSLLILFLFTLPNPFTSFPFLL